MDESILKKGTDSSVVAKAGVWYTICNFVFRGMAFITTPIFTRLLSKADLGTFSNYASWITILIVLTSFDLSTSIIRSKVEHEDDIDSYIWSILVFSTLFTLLLYGIACLNQTLALKMFQLEDMRYLHLMFWYFLATPAYTMLITKHRAFYKYKLFVVLTAIMTVSSTGLSLCLVLRMEDKLFGRALGQYLPSIVIGSAIFVYLAYRGKHIKKEYWKYALYMCVPLVPHTLSIHLLSSSDKILITQICGAEYTAIYSVACNCYQIISIFLTSLNKAWTPWLFENLHSGRYSEIKRVSKIYTLVFITAAIGLLLIGPEIIWIFGGKKYEASVYCLAPLLTGSIFQFVYTLYVNVEFYTKKTVGVAVVTMIATGLNIVLNLIFIPMFLEKGYIVAAYTTLIGYVVLFALHYLLIRRLGMAHVYDAKLFALILLCSLVFMFAVNFLYMVTIVRYAVIFACVIAFSIILYKNKQTVLALVKKRRK